MFFQGNKYFFLSNLGRKKYDPAKNAAVVNTSSSFSDWKHGIYCPKGNMGWAEEIFWLVTKCHCNSAKAVDKLCKQQFKFCGKHISATPRALLIETDWHFTQRQPSERAYCHPTAASVKQCIMSPVKPLQCRSVTTHLFSQHSLASLSDCSLSSHNPVFYCGSKRCRTAALDFAVYTPSQECYCFYCLIWHKLIWNILMQISYIIH